MEDVQRLITDFRRTIDIAHANGEFDKDFSFNHFPRGCCGDASNLLGEYLFENNIQFACVCGNPYLDDPKEGTQSHAWLLVDGMISDITGDQFRDRSIYNNCDIPDYYGPKDDFHKLIDVEGRDVHSLYKLKNFNSFCLGRLYGLYGRLKKHL